MKRPFFSRYSLVILMAVFFLAPFALRGARMAIQNMKNDVKDWLPSDFAETTELDWFRQHFLGEQFVVVSWEHCDGRDESFMTFVDKFFPEVPPSIQQIRELARERGEPVPPEYGDAVAWPVELRRKNFIDPQTGMYVRQLRVGDLPPEENFIGNQLGLRYASDAAHYDWGGEKEKWLLGNKDQWYYILPNGDLYRWKGQSNVIQPIKTAYAQATGEPLQGDLIVSLGEVDGPWYYENPRRLNARLFKTVMTGPGTLHDLTKPGGSLSDNPEEALQRLTGSLFGPDGQQTSMIVTLTEAAKRDLRSALGRGLLGKRRGAVFEIAEESGINPPADPQLLPPPLSWVVAAPPAADPPTLKLGGPPIDNVAIDEEGQITLFRLVGLSIVVGIGLSWFSFRSVYITIMVFFVGGISATASLSFVYWGGQSVDAVLMSMPSLVYVLGLSGAVHIINYYGESVSEVGLRRAADEAIKLGWKPCTLAALTTSLGLMSLYASNILPIRKFGLFSAIGVMATLFLLFTYLPAALQTWPPRRFRKGSASHTTSTQRIVEGFWMRLGEVVVKHNVVVAILCLISMLTVGFGLTRINTDVQLLKMFDSQATIIGDYKWLEQHLGKLVPMELVVRVEPKMIQSSESDGDQDRSTSQTFPLTFLERMEITTAIANVLENRLGDGGDKTVGQPMMAATFTQELPPPGAGGRTAALRGAYDRQLLSHRSELFNSDFLRIDNDDASELWRISLRLGALNDIDYGVFVDDLKQAIEPVLAAYQAREKILQALASQSPDGTPRNTKVLLVGAPFGGDKKMLKPDSASNESSEAESTETVTAQKVSQTEVFSKALGKLLLNAGVALRKGENWHDPRYELPDNWEAMLSESDCAVLIDPNGNYDLDVLQTHSKLFVDASGHEYLAAEGTAYGRDEPISVVYTGLVPVVYKAQRTLLVSLIESTGWAFGMIAVVMMFVVRSMRAGLLSMLPNVYPVVAVFGAMGWMGVFVDIGSMMTASVAMGVAVDDTIHFLTWFRRGLDEGRDRNNAILLAYRRVGLAMTQTTLIGGFGLSIFAFSTFTPTQRFGTLMLALLAAALIGDLIFLPALLASPLGRVFDGKRRKPKNSPAPTGLEELPPSHHSVHQPQTFQGQSDRPSKWLRRRSSQG